MHARYDKAAQTHTVEAWAQVTLTNIASSLSTPLPRLSTDGPWIFTARKGFHIATQLYEYPVNIFHCKDKTRVWISIIHLLYRTRNGRLSNDRNDVYATCYPKDLEAILEIDFSKYE